MSRQVNTLVVPEGCCVQVCRGDALIGYAIAFSGRWDAYVLNPFTAGLSSVGIGIPDRQDAVNAVVRGAMR